MGKKRHKKGWSCRHGNYKEIDKKEELRRFRGFQACTPIISERESLRQSNALSLRCFLSLLLSNTLSLYLSICTLLFQSIYSILLSDCLLYIYTQQVYFFKKTCEKTKADQFGSSVKKLYV
jgi:hypothetical protein